MKKRLLLIPLLIIGVLACKKDTVTPSPPIKQTNQTPIPNGDFEDVANYVTNNPFYNWQTNACNCTGPFDPYVVKEDSQTVYHGKYSADLIYNGSWQAHAKNKFATSTHPLGLQGYVKCNMIGTDTTSIIIKLFKNGTAVDSGSWQGTSSISNWTQVNIPISHNAVVIDTALIIITGGKLRSPNSYTISTSLWVDNLSFY